jgi:hypothetical protein
VDKEAIDVYKKISTNKKRRTEVSHMTVFTLLVQNMMVLMVIAVL